MKKVQVFYLFILLWILFARAKKKPKTVDITQFTNDEGYNWNKEVSSLTIGDVFVSDDNPLHKIQKELKTFILGVSSSNCDEWCKDEIIIYQTKLLFESKEIQFKNQSIPFVRLDSRLHKSMLDLAGVKLQGKTRLFLFHKNKYFTMVC